MGFAPNTKNAIIDKITSLGSFISLHSADCGEDGANEVIAAKRVQAVFPSAVAGESAAVAVVWHGIPAGTYTHFGVWDAPTGGNFIHGNALLPHITTSAAGELKIVPFVRFPQSTTPAPPPAGP